MTQWTNQSARLDNERSWKSALSRGACSRCPQCGNGRMFSSFLKVAPVCEACALRLDGHRADDFPPYVTMMIVGHIVVPLMLVAERMSDWPLWLHAIIWLPLTLVLTMLIIQPVKGALIGYQWALRMHGFDPSGDALAKPQQF
ncbi:Protein of unknown function DUF983 [Rhabdaerophilaceae bacterium]